MNIYEFTHVGKFHEDYYTQFNLKYCMNMVAEHIRTCAEHTAWNLKAWIKGIGFKSSLHALSSVKSSLTDWDFKKDSLYYTRLFLFFSDNKESYKCSERIDLYIKLDFMASYEGFLIISWSYAKMHIKGCYVEKQLYIIYDNTK